MRYIVTTSVMFCSVWLFHPVFHFLVEVAERWAFGEPHAVVTVVFSSCFTVVIHYVSLWLFCYRLRATLRYACPGFWDNSIWAMLFMSRMTTARFVMGSILWGMHLGWAGLWFFSWFHNMSFGALLYRFGIVDGWLLHLPQSGLTSIFVSYACMWLIYITGIQILAFLYSRLFAWKSDALRRTRQVPVPELPLKRISERVENPTPAKVGSIWHYTGRENESEFGSFIQRVYDEKPWLDPKWEELDQRIQDEEQLDGP